MVNLKKDFIKPYEIKILLKPVPVPQYFVGNPFEKFKIEDLCKNQDQKS